MRSLTFRLLLILCVLASTAQGFIAQTHVHASGVAATASALASVADGVPEAPQCLLCEVAGHTPAVALLAPPAPPVITGVALPLPLSTSIPPYSSLASHHWLGRAPPTV